MTQHQQLYQDFFDNSKFKNGTLTVFEFSKPI